MNMFASFRARGGRTHVASSLTLRSVARSHIGHVRKINEDRLLNFSEQRLWAVADGMGGHCLGDEAATIVVRGLADLAADTDPITRKSIGTALERANDAILARGRSSGQVCGSTVAGLHIVGTSALIFWAGDSRIYRLRQGSLERLSRDHSVVQELADAGLISERQARDHPQAHVITRAIGVDSDVAIEYCSHSVQAGDLFLLCSDGLSGPLVDGTIQSLLKGPLSDISIHLQHAALQAGGADNISLILVEAHHDA